jgi:hypothetical protein
MAGRHGNSSLRSAEERFVLALAKLDPSETDRATAHDLAASPAFSWDDAFALAVAHRVHPMVAHNVANEPDMPGSSAAEFRARLRALRASAAGRLALYRFALAPVVDMLARHGIPLTLMKGAAVAETLYPRGTRLLNDFDVLIHRGDYHRVVAAFGACGFTIQVRPGRSEESELRHYHQVALVKTIGEFDLTVDLHWLMYPPDRPFCQIDPAALMARAKRVPFGGQSVFVLSPEDMLVHYGSQLVNDDLRVTYQRLCDIHALAQSGPCWESIVEISRRAGAAGPTHLALSLAARMGADVPAEVFRQLGRDCRGCRLSSRFCEDALVSRSTAIPRLITPLLIALLYPRTADRVRFIASYVRRGWRAGRERRGRVQVWLAAARHVRSVGVWAGRGALAHARARGGG